MDNTGTASSTFTFELSPFGAERHRARPAKAIRTGLPDYVIQAGQRHGNYLINHYFFTKKSPSACSNEDFIQYLASSIQF
jgi:hypothetical protein